MKRAALYCRVSTVDQHPETQLGELRQFAAHKGFQIIGEYTDHGFSGTKARRPELDRMMDDARRHRFDVLLVWSCDRLARSTKHLLQTIDELNGMGIQFLSQREAIDTEGPLGRVILVIVSAMAELERFIYGRAKGVFAGVSLGGATMAPDNNANYRLYGKTFTATYIARGTDVQPSEEGKSLVTVLDSKIAKHSD
jgi:Resolvase, N terminal domain/Las17-binding protein actin regulator